MPTPAPTVDELVATIQRSSLPTVVVEGADDVIIYRWMEAFLGTSNVDFLPCNSRTTVLSLFERRGEFRSNQVVFVADKDMWVFGTPPAKYADVVFTDGYSIENDVLSSRAADRLFEAEEKAVFGRIISVLEEWFAFEAVQWSLGLPFEVGVPIKKVIEFPAIELSRTLSVNRKFIPVTGPIRQEIHRDPMLYIRGKNLLDAYAHVLNGGLRASRYSRRAILEICVKMPDSHERCDRIVGVIRQRFGIQ